MNAQKLFGVIGGEIITLINSRKIKFRKSVMSVIIPPVILGAEMAAPILWAPGFFWFFLLKNPHAHKILRFRGGWGEGGVLGFSGKGGGSANFIFMGAGIFLKNGKV